VPVNGAHLDSESGPRVLRQHRGQRQCQRASRCVHPASFNGIDADRVFIAATGCSA